MKITFTLLLLLFALSNVYSQSVTAEYEQNHRSNGLNEIPLYDGTLITSGDSFRFGERAELVMVMNPLSISVSDNSKKVAFLQVDGSIAGSIYDYRGNRLVSEELEFADLTDETMQITVFNTGEFVLRDNVANFSFFDVSGNRAYTYSNSSGASGGELPSGIAVSADGELIVAYNPVIRFKNDRGSRASVVLGDGVAEQIFSFRNQTIESLKVSENGAFIGAILRDDTGSARFIQFDRFGNELQQLRPGTDLNDFSLGRDGELVTLVSGNRMQVYNTITGERLGSATARSRIAGAAYFPEESMIISVGGRHQNNRIIDPEITAIDLDQRQIDRFQLDGEISLSEHSDVLIRRLNSGTYKISGFNKTVLVSVDF